MPHGTTKTKRSTKRSKEEDGKTNSKATVTNKNDKTDRTTTMNDYDYKNNDSNNDYDNNNTTKNDSTLLTDTSLSFSVQDEIDFLRQQIAEIELQQQLQQQSYLVADAVAIEVVTSSSSSSSNNNKNGKKKIENYPADTTKTTTTTNKENTSGGGGSGGGNCATKSTAIIIGIGMIVAAIFGLIALVHFMKDGNIHFIQAKNAADAQASNLITLEELALHNTANDCWVVYYGVVYDMTNYAKRHPGGTRIITRLAGTDGTNEFERFHSQSLLRSVQNTIVGTLSSTEETTTTTSNNNNGSSSSSSSSSSAAVTPPSDGCSLLEGSTTSNCVSITELQSHNTASDCWVALYGNVYDLTNYARRHPGGSQIVTNLAGTDGTNEYAQFHRKSRLDDVQYYLIGPYEGGTEAIENSNNGAGPGGGRHHSHDD